MTGIMVENDSPLQTMVPVGSQLRITYNSPSLHTMVPTGGQVLSNTIQHIPPLLLTYKKTYKNVVVRKAVLSDLFAIKMIEIEPPIAGDIYNDELLCFMIPSTYVATDDTNQVVGFIIAHVLTAAILKRVQRAFPKPFVPKKGAKFKGVLNIVNMKVLGSCQKQGVGKQLVYHILRKSHKFVTYETLYFGRHVIESCCSYLKYKKLPSPSLMKSYTSGDKAHCISFECQI
eukprot:1993934-Prymnesium_polylepis.1